MKVVKVMFGLLFSCFFLQPFPGSAQAEEAQQLLLDVEKLSKFKQILNDLKKGYAIVFKGYTTIKDISEGNFKLHQNFLDGLLQVSPIVQHYKRVTDIIVYQGRIIKDYKSAFSKFSSDKNFTPPEIQYLAAVYNHLLSGSAQNLEDLLLILTANNLRMSDEERLQAIDKIFAGAQQEWAFLNDFNNHTALLSLLRSKEQADIAIAKKMYGMD